MLSIGNASFRRTLKIPDEFQSFRRLGLPHVIDKQGVRLAEVLADVLFRCRQRVFSRLAALARVVVESGTEGDAMNGSDDIARWSALTEGQFFEREGAFARPGNRRLHPTTQKARGGDPGRNATAIARDIAKTLARTWEDCWDGRRTGGSHCRRGTAYGVILAYDDSPDKAG